MRIWVTRAEPGAGRTAEALVALGHEPVVRPLLTVRPVAAEIDLSDVTALAFTSRNGVEAFAALDVFEEACDRYLFAFAVGEATMNAAFRAGFTAVVSRGGDVAQMVDLIAESEELRGSGVVLYPGPTEPAQDLVALLADRGVKGRHVAVYETTANPDEPLDLTGIDAILVHSAKAARVLAARLSGLSGLEEVAVYGISLPALAPLHDFQFREFAAASFPNEGSLLKLTLT